MIRANCWVPGFGAGASRTDEGKGWDEKSILCS